MLTGGPGGEDKILPSGFLSAAQKYLGTSLSSGFDKKYVLQNTNLRHFSNQLC
jgi:hypothetical protein